MQWSDNGFVHAQAWWSELVTEGGAPPGRFAHAAAGAGETMYTIGGYAQGELDTALLLVHSFLRHLL